MLSYLLAIFTAAHLFPALGNDLVIIRGKVMEQKTGKPLPYIHSFLKDGEEEDLTSKNGTFTIRTYAKAPYTITFRHPGYKTEKVRWLKPGEQMEVYLQKIR